jgi:hypothetical protein
MRDDLTTAPTAPTFADEAAGASLPSQAAAWLPGGRGWRLYLPAVAGISYLAAWTTGLAEWPANLAVNAPGAQVAASYEPHTDQAVVQYLLVEGLAGVLLGVVLGYAVLSRSRGRFVVQPKGAALLAAISVVVSIVQCVIGIVLAAASARHDTVLSGDLFALVNRLDGAKMLAVAGCAAWLAASRPMARWLQVTGLLLAVAITVSGLAYLALSNALAWTAYISGPLLLMWVTGIGVWLTVQRRRQDWG